MRRIRLGLVLCIALLLALLPLQAASAVNEPISVTANGVTTGYATFEEAWTAANNAGTATITVSQNTEYTGAAMTLDVNSDITLTIPTGVTLTMFRYFGYPSAANDKTALRIQGGGTVHVTNGYGVNLNYPGTLEVRDCHIISDSSHAIHVTKGTALIHSGRFSGNGNNGYGLNTTGGNDPSIRIFGGSFQGGAGALNVVSKSGALSKLSHIIDSSAVAYHYAGGSKDEGWTLGDDLNTLTKAEYGTVSVEPLPIALDLVGHNTVVLTPGGSATLAVSPRMSGGDPSGLSYQWYRDGAAIAGATGTSYQLPTDLAANSVTEFYCQTVYAGFTAVSPTVTVRITRPNVTYACWYSLNGDEEPVLATTLDRAFTAAKSADSAEIHLMQNQVLSSTITVDRGNIAFYGDGYTLESSTNYLFRVQGSAQLSLMNGTIHPTNERNSYAFYMQGGTVNMRGGTISCDQRRSYGFYCSAGTLNFSGGTILAAENSDVGIYAGSEAVVNVSGGSISATGAGAIALSVADGGTMYVNGGSFSGNGVIVNVNTGTMRISGGRFNGRINCTTNAGNLSTILSPGYAFYITEGENAGWVGKPETLSTVSGAMEIRQIPVELVSYTETVEMLVNGYTTAPVLSVNARARMPGGSLSYQWYRDGVAIAGATGTSYQVPIGLKNVRTHYACAILCDGYELFTGNITVTVAPEGYVHEPPTNLHAQYGQNLAEVALPNPEGNSEGVWSWEEPYLSVGNVGVNRFNAVFTPTLDWLYEPVKVQLSITVEKTSPRLVIDPDYLAGNPLDKVYNGNSVRQPDLYYVKIENGKSDAKLGIRWYDSKGTLLSSAPKDAGTYEAEIYLPGTTNANAASVRMPAIILAKEIVPTVILSNYRYDYDRTAKKPTVTVRDGNVKLDPSEYSVRYEDNLNAGTATVIVTDNPGGNYIFQDEAKETFEISKVALTVTSATATGKVYDGRADVDVSAISLQGIKYLNEQADQVEVDVDGLKGYVTYDDVHPDAGIYEFVSFRDVLQLIGDAADNYILLQPVGGIHLSSAIEITKYDIPAEDLVSLNTDEGEDVRFVSNRYKFPYQWPMTVLFPDLEEPMQWSSPVYSWTAQLNEEFYKGSGSSDQPSKDRSLDISFDGDILNLPIGWEGWQAPQIEEGVDLDIGWIEITMYPKNYEPISYKLRVFANTKVTAVIIDWEQAEAREYDGTPFRGYDFAVGKNALGIRPVTWVGSEEELPKNVSISVTYSGRDDTIYRVTDKMPTQAGKYTVTASVDKNDQNYIGINSMDFEILKTAPDYEILPRPADDLVYRGGVLPLIEPGRSEDGDVVYSLNEEGPYSFAVPFGVTAGEYKVYYKILGDRNHKDSEVPGVVTVTITKDVPGFIAPRPIPGMMYNGYEMELVVPGRSSHGTVVYSLDGVNFSQNVPTAKEVGTYTVYYKVLGDENHCDSEVGQVTVNVGIVRLTVRSITARNRPYNGSANVDVTVSFYENNTTDDLGVKCSAQLVLDENGHPNAGSYERVNITDLRLTGKDAANYLLSETELLHAQLATPVEITKVPASQVTVDKYIQIYAPYVYTWNLEELIPPEIPAELRELNQPEYELVRISFDEPYYSGGAKVENGQFIIPIDEVDAEKANKVGSVAFHLFFENYEYDTNTNCCFILHSSFKPDVDITGVTSAGRVPYTGSGIRGFNGTPTSAHTGDYDISYEGVGGTDYPSSTQQPVNVGKYSVTIRIPSSNLDMTGSVTLNFEIVRAVPVVKGISDGSVAYLNGGAASLLSGVSTNGGTLQFALETEGEALSWSETVPTVREEGDYTVWYRVLENDNFEALEPASVTVSVKDRAPVIPPAPVTPGGSSGSAPDVSSGGLTASNIDGVTTATVGGILAGQLRDQISDEVNQPVQIEVSTGGEPVDSLQVTVEAEAMRVLSTSVDVPVTVSTPVADVTLSAEGMDSLAKQDSDLCIELSKADGGVRVDLTMDGEAVKSIPGGVKVTVPCANPTAGTVAVLVGEDGSETLIRKSVTGENSLTAIVDGSAYIKWVENGKRFDDVAGNHWASDAIAFVSSRELMSGTGKTTFSPGSSVTRGMLAQILFNLENAPEGSAKANFADVLDGRWYTEAINWAASEGIVTGYKDNQFRPEARITREQFATMLYRYMGSPDPGEAALDFRDADEISAYAVPAMRWAVKIGLFTGRAQQRLAPGDTATRAEAAIILQRLCKYMAGVQ